MKEYMESWGCKNLCR
uniref:Uncharacterized protein n=1 Tax=Anguilla anguilla TaxID=7936 RepID=A0A0E9V1H6_ANGAN